MNPLSILRDAWYFFSRHLGTIALLCLPLIILETLTQLLLAEHYSAQLQGAGDLISGLLFYPLYSAALILYLDTRTRGLAPGLPALWNMALRLWPTLALLTALSSLLIMLGVSLFVLPGVWLMVKLAFAEYLLVLRGLRPLAALRESLRLTTGQFWPILLLQLCILIPVWSLEAWLFGRLGESSGAPQVLLGCVTGLGQLFAGVVMFRCFMVCSETVNSAD
ncbi:hypothetical protein [Pseudomonas sp. B392_1p]|uniref:hypothetical protein n=1 Tax=Pseudomonas sp. B392_1p TaxID=3457507 RepID=UPI003FD3F277